MRSSHPGATPILLLHGWPGSFLEFLDLIPLLSEPQDGRQPFDVVVPSIPGFGFSTPLADAGWNTDRIAGALTELMTHFGYPSSAYTVYAADAQAQPRVTSRGTGSRR